MEQSDYVFSLPDLTAPAIQITSNLPPPFSDEQQWTFAFECIDASPCTTYCSVHSVGTTPNFEVCETQWTASGFENENTLEFTLHGVDNVGNVAPLISHQWTVGKKKCLAFA